MKRNCTIFRETYAPLLCLADHIRKQVFDGLHKGRDPMKKNVFFRALPEKGGGGVYPWPKFLALFLEVHFWSIKRVYFFKNANVLNF